MSNAEVAKRPEKMYQGIYLKIFCFIFDMRLVLCQIDAPYDFATHTKGERTDELSPGEIAGIAFGILALTGAMVVTVLFCYYVRRKQVQEESSGSSFLASREGY